jgi:cell division protein FtsQ
MSDLPPPAAPEAPGSAPLPGAGSAPGPAAGSAVVSGPAAAAGPAGTVPGAPFTGGPGGAGLAAGGRAPRRHSRWRAAFFALAGVAIVAGAGWALLGNRLLVVRSVTVTGTHLVTPAEVLAKADVPVGTPLLSVDAGSVTRRVETIRQVASATVTEDWPDHVVIAVTERVPVMAAKMKGGGYDQVDSAGVTVLWTATKPAALPLLETPLAGAALPGNPGVTTVADVLAELRPGLARQVADVKAATVADGTQQVILGLRDGKTVVWGSAGNAAQKNRELAILLPDSGASEIDVSSPGTVVTR